MYCIMLKRQRETKKEREKERKKEKMYMLKCTV